MGSREKTESIVKEFLEDHGKDFLHRFKYKLKEIQINDFQISEIRSNYKLRLLKVSNGD